MREEVLGKLGEGGVVRKEGYEIREMGCALREYR